MNKQIELTPGPGDIELMNLPPLEMTAEAVRDDFTRYYARMLGRRTVPSGSPFAFQALVYATRDRLMERWNRVNKAREAEDGRQVSYISLEFLMGRLLRNALLSLDLEDEAAAAMESLGVKIEELYEAEHDAGLGNGGLGRLAACFLDSCASLKLNVMGYGLRYRYGMFHQRIDNGYQQEEPDSWLRDGYPWEIERSELAQLVHFDGHTEAYQDEDGTERHRWVGTHDVLAIPFDVPVPGYRNGFVNTLRLWSAHATDEFDLDEFNAGSYTDAVAQKNAAQNITMVLYPNDASESGQELRVRQQYFLTSASLQDTLRDWKSRHQDFDGFADKHCFQLNDTHPAMAVAELMRLLVDEEKLEWDEAWDITRRTMAYTNHTLLPEALERWPVRLFQRLLPRVLDIILAINSELIAEVNRKWPGDHDRVRHMSIIEEGFDPMVRMAHLAIAGSHSVNGVAELHSQLLKQGLFREFAQLWPEKFNNKTNGVTHRRWLAACNPELGELISSAIGDGWVRDMAELEALREHASDSAFQDRWRVVRRHNKRRLASVIADKTGIHLNEHMMFDVQVKRIHEYKRQLLNVLHAVHLYDRIRRGEGDELVPRAIIIGGKAAPGYDMAKSIVKCINNVAGVINNDPLMQGRLNLVFFPDYNVSAMEIICPATNLSEQISTAGREASGTGNMKFMMNGAVTIGTLDGANVEIREAVGPEHFYLFGLTVEEVEASRVDYDPATIIAHDPDFSRVMHLLESGHFNATEPGVLDPIIHAVRDAHDPWMTAADFRSLVDTQNRVNDAFHRLNDWTRSSILNTAASGQFSTDRTISDYNRDIWKLSPLDVDIP
ncbi:MAG: glycogen/starch/alpha-glucan phosphorylase [Xanthomonadales bacterium]|nr:glycogen/starch/alpha-glucan phosphorylase [Xanthomonadales bacterium]